MNATAPGPGLPLQDPAVVGDLGDDLRAAGYDAARVPAVLGRSAERALGRGEFWPALRATEGGGALHTLIRLLLLGSTETVHDVAAALPRTGVRRALTDGVLERDGDGVRAALDIRPHADDDRDFLVVSDLDSDTRPGPVRREHVLGIGQASLSLARAVIRRPVRRALDLGTGCGIQALHLDSHVEQIVATDTNPRALALAAATAGLNGMSWDLRSGSLFAPVTGERFDLIVSNPPFVIGAGEQQYLYRDSGMVGDGICEALVRGLPDHLEPGGVAQLLANWMVIGEQDWRKRVAGWLEGSDCDAWVVQRELADPTEYVTLWLSDAGEDPEAAARHGREWLDWFSQQQVTGIGMGVITLRRREPGEHGPIDRVLDEIAGVGEEVTGPEAAAFLARRRWLSGVEDAALLRTRLRLDDAVLLEERSLAGHQGWMPVLRMLTRIDGPGARLQLDEWGRALLAGCRGEAPLGLLVELLAAAHGLDEVALAKAVLPSVRVAVGRGILHPTEIGSVSVSDPEPRP